MRSIAVASAFLCFYPSVLAYTAEHPLAFEVASVKSTVPVAGRGTRTGADGIDFEVCTFRFCISYAYRVKSYQISGPAWIDDEFYQIVAKMPPLGDRQKMPEMLQTLLANRFKLQIHRAKQDFHGYDLVVGQGGPKFSGSTREAERMPNALGNIPAQPLILTEWTPGGGWRLRGINATMKSLAESLSLQLERPVVDQTEVKDGHDFVLNFNRQDKNLDEPTGPESAGSNESIFTSIRSLGLQLKPAKVTLDLIVVDRAERVPTPN